MNTLRSLACHVAPSHDDASALLWLFFAIVSPLSPAQQKRMGAPELTSHYNVILSNQDNFAKIFFFTLHFFEKKDLPPKKNRFIAALESGAAPEVHREWEGGPVLD